MHDLDKIRLEGDVNYEDEFLYEGGLDEDNLEDEFGVDEYEYDDCRLLVGSCISFCCLLPLIVVVAVLWLQPLVSTIVANTVHIVG